MKPFILLIFILTNLFSADPYLKNRLNPSIHTFSPSLNRIGDYTYPTDPLLDRAKGYLLKGKAKTAVSNYGNFITWDYHPAGFWGEYGYLAHVGLMAGVPGHEYSSAWSSPGTPSWVQDGAISTLWYSTDAYSAWVDGIDDPENEVGNYKTVVYNTVVDIGIDDRGHNDRGNIAIERSSLSDLDLQGETQWFLAHELGRVYLFLEVGVNPNYASSGIGLAYPWAIRPKLKERLEEFDLYDYGDDLEEWTDDDEYVYYGANTAESWFIRDDGFGHSINTDWQATTEARYNTHNLDNTAGHIFGNTVFTNSYDPGHLIAHSEYPSTWPTKYSFDMESYIPFWPGWWADEYYGDSPDSWSDVGIYDCNEILADEGCWKPIVGGHISDMDVYMEFDDRWASIGNEVVDNEYVSTGYPMGIKVMAMGHSYSFDIAEDILFFTIKVRNESGDYCAFERDKNQLKIPVKDENNFVVCKDGMIMPDGTKLNRGKGFNYKKVNMGFYFEADVLTTDIEGGFSVHTNEDDFMEYIDCLLSKDLYPEGCPTYQGDMLRIGMVVIGDYDGISNSAEGYSMETGLNMGTDFGVVAVQLLDSPYATEPVDMDQDGFTDIYPGEKLKMTDWHWFDWYNRPGVLAAGVSDNAAANKELIQYQVMAGDNTNLTEPERMRYFHTANPHTDLDSELNPHFDSLEGLKETSFFQDDPDGMDCLFIMSSGPFDLEVGEQVSISFTVIYGQSLLDLTENARIAQILYNRHYSAPEHPTAPINPELAANPGEYSITLNWNDTAEQSVDYLTGEQDFQGYKIYRSLDNGITWGDSVFNFEEIHVGWKPIIQFDIDDDISGMDSLAPWINLGSNTGLQYSLTDTNLFAYNEYCYSITAYDSGLEPDVIPYDDNGWLNFEGGYVPLESNIGENMLCLNPVYQDILTPLSEFLFKKNDANIGWSQITYIPHNVDTVNPGLFKFEIQAEVDSNSFQFSRINNPKLFIYEVNEEEIFLDSLISGFPIYSIDALEAEDNWLDALGMYINWKNYLSQPSSLYITELDTVNWLTGPIYSNDELLSFNFEFSTNPIVFNKRPYFDYIIEFGEPGLDIATHPPCHTLLPFKITNQYTGKKVSLRHRDRGIHGETGQNGDLGYGDCQYTRNEMIKFYETGIDLNNLLEEYNTYNLSFDWVIQSNEDNLIYPWSTDDSLIIIPKKMLHDGDSWLVDMSIFTETEGSVAINNGLIPDHFNLSAAYPNPFNPVTKIDYSIPQTIDVSIIIYDLLGRQLEIIQSGLKNPGNYNIVWDASQYSSGLYFVKMIAGKNIQTQKLMLIK